MQTRRYSSIPRGIKGCTRIQKQLPSVQRKLRLSLEISASVELQVDDVSYPGVVLPPLEKRVRHAERINTTLFNSV